MEGYFFFFRGRVDDLSFFEYLSPFCVFVEMNFIVLFPFLIKLYYILFIYYILIR